MIQLNQFLLAKRSIFITCLVNSRGANLVVPALSILFFDAVGVIIFKYVLNISLKVLGHIIT